MTPFANGNITLGLVVTFVSWMVLNPPNGPRRLPFLGAVAILVGVSYLGQFLLPPLQNALREVFLFRRITEGAVFIGLFVASLALFLFERKESPRRVTLWAGFGLGVIAMFEVQALLDAATGKFQDASLRVDVNRCTDGMVGQANPTEITNNCDFPVVVGLCLSNEANPDQCAQSVVLAPGASGAVQPTGEGMASMPSNLNGATIVACRPPHRPSRTSKVGGRGHRGVCLPGP